MDEVRRSGEAAEPEVTAFWLCAALAVSAMSVPRASEHNEYLGPPSGTSTYWVKRAAFERVRIVRCVHVHRVAVRRAWAGRGLAGMMLAWCDKHAERLGCGFVRLDCDAQRPKLRAPYERLGFRYHSERHVGRHTVARYERSVRRGGLAVPPAAFQVDDPIRQLYLRTLALQPHVDLIGASAELRKLVDDFSQRFDGPPIHLLDDVQILEAEQRRQSAVDRRFPRSQ